MPPPRRQAPKRKQMKRKLVSKRKSYGTNVLVGKTLNPVPQRTIVKMKYAEAVQSSLIAGVANYQFNLNSIFDPNRTGIGHQPYGRDTFETLYNRYRVISCSYVVSTLSNNGFVTQLAVLPANEALVMSSVSEARENPRCKYTIQSPNAPIRLLTGNVYIPSLVGRTKAQYMADDCYQAQMSASPVEAAILNIFTGLISDNSTADSNIINVTLEYTVEFFDVKHLAQS